MLHLQKSSSNLAVEGVEYIKKLNQQVMETSLIHNKLWYAFTEKHFKIKRINS